MPSREWSRGFASFMIAIKSSQDGELLPLCYPNSSLDCLAFLGSSTYTLSSTDCLTGSSATRSADKRLTNDRTNRAGEVLEMLWRRYGEDGGGGVGPFCKRNLPIGQNYDSFVQGCSQRIVFVLRFLRLSLRDSQSRHAPGVAIS